MHFESVDGPSIPRFNRGRKGVNLSMKRDKLVKASFKSETKLDGDSRAFCSDSFPFGPLDRLAENGIVPLRCKVFHVEHEGENDGISAE